jgi:hypothetical protein
MAGSDSAAGSRVRQEYGDFLASLANALTWADQWVEAERFLTLALSCLPPDSPARERIEDTLRRVATSAAGQRLKERSASATESPDTESRNCVQERVEANPKVGTSPAPAPVVVLASDGKVFQFPTEANACAFETEVQAAGGRSFRLKPRPPRTGPESAPESDTSPTPGHVAVNLIVDGKVLKFRDEQSAQGFIATEKEDGREAVRVPAVVQCGDGRVFSFPTHEAAQQFEAGVVAEGGETIRLEPQFDQISEVAGDSIPVGSIDGFVQLCSSFRAKCPRRFREGGSADLAESLFLLKAANVDYKERVAPWLAVILESHPGDIATRAGNAAARCLRSLAEGFISVHEFDTAGSLLLQALTLIDDETLESLVRRQLADIGGQAQKSVPKPRRTGSRSNATGRSGFPMGQTATPRPVRGAHSLFDWLWTSRRRPLFLAVGTLAVGIAALVGILSLSRGNEPDRSPLAVSPSEHFALQAPAAADFKRRTLNSQLEVLEHASPREKEQLMPIFAATYNREIAKVPEDQVELLLRRMATAGLLDASGAQRPSAQEGQDALDELLAAAPAARPSERAIEKVPPPPAGYHLVEAAKDPIEQTGTSGLGPKPSAGDVAESPAVPPREPVSLPNGTNLISPPAGEGRGRLEISNHTSQDAVVKLKTSVGKETVRLVYVRAMSDLTIPKIPVGNYMLEFATGRDWDETSRSFRRNRAFSRFDAPFVFSETPLADGTRFSVNSVTLHGVANGNAKTDAISAEDFADDVGVRGIQRRGR